MPSNKTIKKTSELKSRPQSRSRSSKSRTPSKSNTLFNELSKTLNNNLISEAIQFTEYNEKINNDYRVSLTKAQKTAINYYQEGSSMVNGFLRKGYQFLSEFKKETIINQLNANNYNNAIKTLIKNINLIDKAFTKENCPKTSQKTILYRGSDKLYNDVNNGYTSCSKSIEALFEMNFLKGDTILSNDCCINVLIIDENIPFLDLENNNDRWKYQQEVLLPRGLNVEVLEESIIKYYSVDFKVYIMRVMLNNNENVYNIPELPRDDTVDMKIIKFIIDEQRSEIINLSNMFIDNEEWTDEKEDINDLIEYIYDLKKKSVFTQEQYSKICKKILNMLKNAIPAMMESAIVRDECKVHLKPALDKVEEILNTEEQLITPGSFIQVKEC